MKNILKAIKGIVIFIFGLILMWWCNFDFSLLTTIFGTVITVFGVLVFVRSQIEVDYTKLPEYCEEDEKLTPEINKLQIKYNFFNILLWITLLGSIALFTVGFIISGIIVLIMCFVVAYFFANAKDKLKSSVADNIIKEALERVFTYVHYDFNQRISDKQIRSVNMGFGSYNTIDGNNRVKAFYNELPVEMSDIHLKNVYTEADTEGDTVHREKTVFRGLWLICDLKKELPVDLSICERRKFGKLFGGNGIKTENKVFNKYFCIESKKEKEILKILTPNMMDCILKISKKEKGKVHMNFLHNGKIHIAINSGKDFFEVGKKIVSATELRAKFVYEIHYITNLIDELKISDI